MIAKLSGTIVLKTPDFLILDVQGVGYELELPASTLCILPKEGEKTALYVYTHVREDALRLFGFASLFDRKVFQALISVTSVGPKMAMSLLGPFDGLELCSVIIEHNLAALTSVPGVGAKTAERLVLELRTKAQKLLMSQGLERSTVHIRQDGSGELVDPLFANSHAFSRNEAILDDLKLALTGLGYKDKQIADLIKKYSARIEAGEQLELESTLRESLKQLSGHLLQKQGNV